MIYLCGDDLMIAPSAHDNITRKAYSLPGPSPPNPTNPPPRAAPLGQVPSLPPPQSRSIQRRPSPPGGAGTTGQSGREGFIVVPGVLNSNTPTFKVRKIADARSVALIRTFIVRMFIVRMHVIKIRGTNNETNYKFYSTFFIYF